MKNSVNTLNGIWYGLCRYIIYIPLWSREPPRYAIVRDIIVRDTRMSRARVLYAHKRITRRRFEHSAKPRRLVKPTVTDVVNNNLTKNNNAPNGISRKDRALGHARFLASSLFSIADTSDDARRQTRDRGWRAIKIKNKKQGDT